MRTVILCDTDFKLPNGIIKMRAVDLGTGHDPVLCCNNEFRVCGDHCAAFEIEDDRHVRCNFAGAEIGVLAEKEG